MPHPKKGCARVHGKDQDTLLTWLGLSDVGDVTHDTGRIGLTVAVQGEY